VTWSRARRRASSSCRAATSSGFSRPTPDLFTSLLLALTMVALAAWRLPVLSAVLAGGVIGIVARSKLVHRVIS